MSQYKIHAIMTRDYHRMAGEHGFGDFISLGIQNTGKVPIDLSGLVLKADLPEDPTESFIFPFPEGRTTILQNESIVYNILPPGKQVPSKGWDMVLILEATGEEMARTPVHVENLKRE